MQITLSQLKEIAKAGYGSISLGRNLLRHSSVDSGGRYTHTLTDNSGAIIMQLITGLKYASIPISFTSNFNHLAAIRKMEELGLIDK